MLDRSIKGKTLLLLDLLLIRLNVLSRQIRQFDTSYP
jgi:hypothetical protein